MSKLKTIKSLADAVEISLNAGECVEYPAKFKVTVDNETWNCYTSTISNRDISLDCDKGYVEYLVDSYGDNHFAVIHDWEKN